MFGGSLIHLPMCVPNMGETTLTRASADLEQAGEVHGSTVPIRLALAVTLCLVALLFPPLAILGFPLLVLTIRDWVREDVALWKARPPLGDEWGDSSWAMVWIVVTESLVFAGFFAFWFWARWHTISWEGATGGAWPAIGVHHDLRIVGGNTAILLLSGVFAHRALDHLQQGRSAECRTALTATIVLGSAFLVIQAYEYSNTGFLWSEHVYGTAFYALTGLHGLHVLAGLIAIAVAHQLVVRGHYDAERHDSFRAVTIYWHFVDAVWVLLFAIVYLEVI